MQNKDLRDTGERVTAQIKGIRLNRGLQAEESRAEAERKPWNLNKDSAPSSDQLIPHLSAQLPSQDLEHTLQLTRGVEHDQGVLLLLQGLPEIVLGQMQHVGLLLLPGGLWQRDGLRAVGGG